MAARARKLERGMIRTTTFKLMSQMKLTPKSSPEAKQKVIDKAAKTLKIDPGTARSVVNFGLREKGVYKDVLAAAKTSGRSAARKGIKTKAKTSARKHKPATETAASPAE